MTAANAVAELEAALDRKSGRNSGSANGFGYADHDGITGYEPLPIAPAAATITDYWRQRRAEQGPRPTADGTRGRGSQGHQCARRIALSVEGIPEQREVSDFDLITWEYGQRGHDMMQRHLENRLGMRSEVKVSYRPDHDISGNVDGVYDWDAWNYVHGAWGEHWRAYAAERWPDLKPHPDGNDTAVEIKTLRHNGWRQAVNGGRYGPAGPKLYHLVQVGLYACSPTLNVTRVHLIYMDKDPDWGTDCGIAEWIIGLDEPLPHIEGHPTIRQVVTTEIARLDAIFAGLDRKELPARVIPGEGRIETVGSPDDKSTCFDCRVCPFNRLCAGLPAGPVGMDVVEKAAAPLYAPPPCEVDATPDEDTPNEENNDLW